MSADAIVFPMMLVPRTLKVTDRGISDSPAPDYFYCRAIDKYVPNEYKPLVDETMRELLDFRLHHGTLKSYQRGCNGPLCRRANRDYHRELTRKKFNRKDKRHIHKPYYHAVEPLLKELYELGKRLDIVD